MLIGGIVRGPNWLALRVQVGQRLKIRLKVTLGSGDGIRDQLGGQQRLAVRGDAGFYEGNVIGIEEK